MQSNQPAAEETFTERLQVYQRSVDTQDFESATVAACDIFALVESWCEKNPSLTLDLTNSAAEFENRGDWRRAESAYQQILSLPDLTPHDEYKAHADLAGLCRLLQRPLDALNHARCATAAARRADSSILLLMALSGEARCLIRCGQFREARDVITEAIGAVDSDKMYNQMRASVLMLRAECDLENGSSTEAGEALDHAYRLLEPLAEMKFAAGTQSALCHWWSVTAKHRAESGDRDGAISAWREAVDIAKQVASLPHANNVYTRLAVAQMLKGLAEALLVCNHERDAAAAFAERKDILGGIGAPDHKTT